MCYSVGVADNTDTSSHRPHTAHNTSMARWGAFLLGLLNLSVHKEQCCNNGVCFTNEAPFDDMPLPKCPERIRPVFKLYSSEFRYLPQVLHPGRIPNTFNGTRRTVFIVHGYMHDLSDLRYPNWDKNLRNKFIQQYDANVVLVDWSRGSREFLYPASASNTRAVGLRMAEVVQTLVEKGNASRDSVWCVGHSLGAHVCGHAGSNYKLGRITGLDPAGPWFENKNWTVGLNPSCADFVDVWHTHGERGLILHFGTMKPLGHVDFYPNGGGQQPGCRVGDLLQEGLEGLQGRDGDTGTTRRTPRLFGIPVPKPKTDLLPDCSHMRVLDLFKESLSCDCQFTVTHRCTDHNDIPDSCSTVSNMTQTMGPQAETRPGRGLFKLETRSSKPFCTQGN